MAVALAISVADVRYAKSRLAHRYNRLTAVSPGRDAVLIETEEPRFSVKPKLTAAPSASVFHGVTS